MAQLGVAQDTSSDQIREPGTPEDTITSSLLSFEEDSTSRIKLKSHPVAFRWLTSEQK
jgi:hypothetical protein